MIKKFSQIAVQILPIIKPQPACPKGKILLCKWTSGDFKDRYTGMIHIPENELAEVDSSSLQAQLENIAKSIVPSSLEYLDYKNLDSVELVSVLKFDGPPKCDEFVYLTTLKDIHKINFEEIPKFEGVHPCFWFNWNEIPFKEMPADDEIWYPKVLWEGQKLTGFFNFGGVAERTIKSYELNAVQDFTDI